MKSAVAHLVGCSPYSQSRHYDSEDAPKKPSELPDDYERRTWRHRMHVADGKVFIPGMSFSNCLKEAAKRAREKIPGQRNATWNKVFEAGVMVPGDVPLGITADGVPFDKLFVPSDGIAGSGKRVTKYFPRIDAWEGKVTFYIFDDLITEPIFGKMLTRSGQLVGIGRFRPERRGFYGRFIVKNLKWLDNDETEKAMAKMTV